MASFILNVDIKFNSNVCIFIVLGSEILKTKLDSIKINEHEYLCTDVFFKLALIVDWI